MLLRILPAVPLAALAALGGYLGVTVTLEPAAPYPAQWLTESEQEQLADLVTTGVDATTAGCPWEGRDPRDIRLLVEAPNAAALWIGTVKSGREVSILYWGRPSGATSARSRPRAHSATYRTSKDGVTGAFDVRPARATLTAWD
jgi:hypothetical protein